MAVKRGAEQKVPANWSEELKAVEGVSVQGATGKRAQFEATPDAVDRVKSKFAENFHIEEAVERRPL